MACGMCFELPGEMEAKDVLSYCDPSRFITHLAVEIDGPQFAGDPVSMPSALWGPAAGLPAGIFLFRTRGPGRAACAGEQGTGVQWGDGGTISPREIDPSIGGGAEHIRMRGRNESGNGASCRYYPTTIKRE